LPGVWGGDFKEYDDDEMEARGDARPASAHGCSGAGVGDDVRAPTSWE
jgi:hypothetical protein